MSDYSVSKRLWERIQRHNIPASVFFTLTERCHLHCQQCYLVEDIRGELDTSEVKDALDQLAEFGATNITFTGGEPLLRPDIYEIIQHASHHGFAITLFTSGTPCNPTRVQKLKQAGVHYVSVTLYAAEAGPHDTITQAEGSWAKTVDGLKNLRKAGLKTEVKYLQMQENRGQLVATRELAGKLGASFVVDFKVTATHDGKRHPLSMQLQEEELTYLYHLMAARDGSFAKQLEPRVVAPNSGMCGAGRTRVVIGSDGQVYPCMDYIPSLGNLREQSLRDIWQGQAVQKVRSYKRFEDPICQVCPDQSHCGYCPSSALLDTGDPTKPSAAICSLARVRRRVYEERTGVRPPSFSAEQIQQDLQKLQQSEKTSSGKTTAPASSCGGGCGGGIPQGLQELLERLPPPKTQSSLESLQEKRANS
ncbi:MAG: radical SAM protein [Myxococcales bacterium]|nr:radical SAM protein [Myxococcales bacterium]